MSVLVVVPHLCLNMLMPYVGALSVHGNVDIDNVMLEGLQMETLEYNISMLSISHILNDISKLQNLFWIFQV